LAWKPETAAAVLSSYVPVTAPSYQNSCASRAWSSRTLSPEAPGARTPSAVDGGAVGVGEADVAEGWGSRWPKEMLSKGRGHDAGGRAGGRSTTRRGRAAAGESEHRGDGEADDRREGVRSMATPSPGVAHILSETAVSPVHRSCDRTATYISDTPTAPPRLRASLYDLGRRVPGPPHSGVWTSRQLLVSDPWTGHHERMADTLHAGSVRIGSADRTLVAEKLVAHYQAGRLPRGELELRLTKVAHAHSDDDLHLLTIDLPDVPRTRTPRSWPPRCRPQELTGSIPLRVAFDVAVLLLTFAAGVCLALLLIVAATGTRPTPTT